MGTARVGPRLLTKHAAAVPKAQVGRLLLGASFPAKVDPSQPEQISIAWDR